VQGPLEIEIVYDKKCWKTWAGRYIGFGARIGTVVPHEIEAARTQYTSRDQSGTQSTYEQVHQAPAVERHEPRQEGRRAVEIGSYETANLNLALRGKALHEIPRLRMAAWIKDVVDTESPVHEDEVARRIADCVGVKRIGRRIRAAFEAGVATATRDGMVMKRGEFLWRADMKPAKLRSRAQLPNSSRNLRLIHEQEIALAIREVVKTSYGIPRDMIPTEVCRLFGFKRTTHDMEAAIDRTVETLLHHGFVREDGGYVSLPSD
jgi:hypothetical protein